MGVRVTTSVAGYRTSWRSRPAVKIIRKIAFYILLVILFFPFFFVFAWMIEGAFKTQVQNTAIPPLFIFEPTLQNFETVFAKNPMWDEFVNGWKLEQWQSTSEKQFKIVLALLI